MTAKIPPPGEAARFFSPDGLLSRAFAGFEYRQQQEVMADAVASSFLEGKKALLEAGTGTGKSFAYLIPSILFSLSCGEKVVISTRTITLQEQLMGKDVPFLKKALPVPFKVCLVKGWSNYLCLRRMAMLMRRDEGFSLEDYASLRKVAEWAGTTAKGDRSEMAEEPSPRVWERICCESWSCAFARCPFYRRCWFFAARREMEDAHLLVINHALLFSDLAIRKEREEGIIPPFRYAIFDEAHHIEDVATEYLGVELSSSGLARLYNQLFRRESPREEGGFLAALRNRIAHLELNAKAKRQLLRFIDGNALSKLTALQDRTRGFFGAIIDLFFGDRAPGEWQVNLGDCPLASEAWTALREEGVQFHTSMAALRDSLRELAEGLTFVEETLEDSEIRQYQTELAGFIRRMEEATERLVFLLNRGSAEHVYWLEYSGSRRTPHIQLNASPLDVSSTLHDLLFSRLQGCVLTSATLAVGKAFSWLSERIGLSLLDEDQLSGEVYPSPFDFKRQVLLGIARDIPEPGAPDFCATLREPLARLLEITGGRSFFLFTSFRMLRECADSLRDDMERLGIEPLVQGEMQRTTLLARFREPGRKVLFGTDSFWEGVDVPGEALSCVVLFRLPFKVPTDPVHSARYRRLEEQGRKAFKEYSIPQAVIKLKQGVGRLIRTARDRGCILILDNRIVEKWYGKFFLKELPPCRIVRGSFDGLLGEIRAAFEAPPGR